MVKKETVDSFHKNYQKSEKILTMITRNIIKKVIHLFNENYRKCNKILKI